MEKSTTKNFPETPPTAKNIFNTEFVASAIIPLIIFYIFSYMQMVLVGTIFSGCWCISIFLFKLVRDHKINVIALLSGIFSVIGLLCTIILRNPTIYLAEPIFEDMLYAVIFFSSLFFPRSLIQVLVEDSHIVAFPEDFRRTPQYKSAWKILTSAWGVLNITQALLRIVLLYSVPIDLYYTISKIYVSVSTPLLIIFSYKFPKWYWKKVGVKRNPHPDSDIQK
jgi:intracellular septation protein A